MDIREKLLNIQQELKAPKNQYNKFGGYNYRSCEDILEAVKPLLKKNACILTVMDEVVFIGSRYYVKATAVLRSTDDVEQIVNTAYAREAEAKKGMDESQITGTASSYARKYALNGLFCIDDVKDADTDEHINQTNPKATDKQIELINKLVTDKEAMLKYYKVDKIENLTMEQASEIIKKKGGNK